MTHRILAGTRRGVDQLVGSGMVVIRAFVLAGGFGCAVVHPVIDLRRPGSRPGLRQRGKSAIPTGARVDTECGPLTAPMDWNDVAGTDGCLLRWQAGDGDLNVGVLARGIDRVDEEYGLAVVRGVG